MEFQAAQYTIDTLLQRIRTSKLALPDFQREFVWDPSRVVELLDSVARQWPIGSLLLLSGPQPFAIREIDSGPKVSGDQLDLYILDGQQRVTSLFHAINDVSDYCYFIKFDSLSSGDDDYIGWERRDKFNKSYPRMEDRAKSRIALIKEIWDLESFYSWLDHLSPNTNRLNIVSLKDRKLGGLQSKVYKVMAIELEQEIDLEALARIFETLNRTGVRLNAFDLMVAALYPSGFRLRGAWDDATSEHEVLRKVNPEAIEIIKLISLIVRVTRGKKASAGVRQGDLLKMDRAAIKEIWPAALDLYVRSLNYCREKFGVTCEEAVPSWSMILGVAGWLRAEKTDDSAIRQWWINRLLDQYFAQAANTRIVSDFELISEFSGDTSFFASKQSLAIMSESSKRNGLLNRGLGGLLIREGALDPISGRPLSEANGIAFRTITEDGSIRKITSSDRIESTIVVSTETDRMIGKEKHVKTLGQDSVIALKSQGISINNYKREQPFLEALIATAPKGEAE